MLNLYLTDTITRYESSALLWETFARLAGEVAAWLEGAEQSCTQLERRIEEEEADSAEQSLQV